MEELSTMAEAKVASKGPFKTEVKAGKTYFWCSCGLSARQPFCDGAHKAEGAFAPYKWVAEKDQELFLCGCKQTKKLPLCDGSHNKIDATDE